MLVGVPQVNVQAEKCNQVLLKPGCENHKLFYKVLLVMTKEVLAYLELQKMAAASQAADHTGPQAAVGRTAQVAVGRTAQAVAGRTGPMAVGRIGLVAVVQIDQAAVGRTGLKAAACSLAVGQTAQAVVQIVRAAAGQTDRAVAAGQTGWAAVGQTAPAAAAGQAVRAAVGQIAPVAGHKGWIAVLEVLQAEELQGHLALEVRHIDRPLVLRKPLQVACYDTTSTQSGEHLLKSLLPCAGGAEGAAGPSFEARPILPCNGTRYLASRALTNKVLHVRHVTSPLLGSVRTRPACFCLQIS